MASRSVARKNPVVAILYPLASILVLFVLASCSAIGSMAYKLSGPTPVSAKYVPKKEPMLVLVENFDNPSANYVDAQRLTAQLIEDLNGHDVAPLIDVTQLYKLRDADPVAFGRMSIPQVGRATGARQVLYVNVQELALTNDGVMARGSASGRVRVVDAAGGTSRWPTELAEGYPFALETPYVRLAGGADEQAVRMRLIRSLSDQISKLFYMWTPVEGVE